MLGVLIRIASSRRFLWVHITYHFQYIKENLTYPKSEVIWFFPKDRGRARNSHGKRAISVRATEVLLYLVDVVTIGVLCSIFTTKYLENLQSWKHFITLRCIDSALYIDFLTHWTRISLSTGVWDLSIPTCYLSLGSESFSICQSVLNIVHPCLF